MKALLKEKVIRLRRRGLTYSEILKAIRTSVSKSTISIWCRGVQLPGSYPAKLARIAKNSQTKGRKVLEKLAAGERKIFNERVISNNANLFNLIKQSKEAQKIALAMLYLGEGAKWKGHRGLMLGSSDPLIVSLYIKLLKSVYEISEESLRVSVLYRADQELEMLKRFWSKILNIPLKQFYKSSPDPRTVGKPTKNKNYKGVCVITCAGTEKQLELESLSKLIHSTLGP